ncbi:Hypothetical protein, putative [Bodo saltans]|uniref:Uncharacterized protein n=1 Tax=Bodo saltans TaxID=75058 RepID=A0A0S4JRW3_BODSA|nr:Hypothetical protein, putative [Bodo saltans]|eukprot:CUG93322.1 Hypothetical protein, putative [Bodo saltans]
MSGSSVACLADLDAQLLLSTPRYALRRHLHQAAISKGSIAYQDPITFDIIHTGAFLTEHPDLCRHVGERHCPHYTEEEIIKPTVAARAELQQHDVRGGGASPSPHSSDDISDDNESSRLGSSSSSSSSSSSGSSTSSSSSSSYASEVSAATSTQNNKNASAIKTREISQAVASSTLTISNKGNQERKVPLSTNTKPDNSNKTATRLWKASPFQRPHGVPFVANDLQKLKSVSNGAKAAAAAAPTAAAHMVVDIEELRAMPKYRQY